jgi:hypothetical protein
MPGWLRFTVVLWCLAVIAAIAGAVAAGPSQQLAQDLFLAAAGVGVVVGVLLLLATMSEAHTRRAARRRPAESPLSRLEYLPAVTSPARRLRWKGSPYWRIGVGAERQVVGRRVPSAAGAAHADVAQPSLGEVAAVEAVAPVDHDAAPRQ